MYELTIPAMRGELCTQNITRAVALVDSGAHANCSLVSQTVEIESSLALATLVKAIDAAGYRVAAAVELMQHHIHHCDQCDV